MPTIPHTQFTYSETTRVQHKSLIAFLTTITLGESSVRFPKPNILRQEGVQSL
jgi:hypothetical protein